MASIPEADDLAKCFGEFEAVKGVSCATDEGEVLSWPWPNGAGKTTLISVLTGVLTGSRAGSSIKGSISLPGLRSAAQRDAARHAPL